MSYIEKTLTTDERIISSSKFHWFYFVPSTLLSLVFISIAILIAYNVPLPFPLLLPFLLPPLLLLSMSPFLYALIIRMTTEQVLTNKRVFIKTGFIRRDTDELSERKVETISIRQSILGRILNFGEIEFTGTGGICLKFIHVSNPTKVKKNYESLIDSQ